jgi:hypothetical protein
MGFYENRYVACSNVVCKSKFVCVLINHYTLKTHGGMKVYLHVCLTSALNVSEFTLRVPDTSSGLKEGLHAFRRGFGGSQQF